MSTVCTRSTSFYYYTLKLLHSILLERAEWSSFGLCTTKCSVHSQHRDATHLVISQNKFDNNTLSIFNFVQANTRNETMIPHIK